MVAMGLTLLLFRRSPPSLALALLLGSIVCSAAVGAPQRKIKVADNVGAVVYLSKFGYMDASVSNPQKGNLISADSVKQAIREFQAFASLNMTGELDEETIRMMNMPRCGVKDKIGFGANAKRRKRYALQGSRWRVKELTYKVTKYPLDLTPAEVDRDIEKAFKVWEEVTDLTFIKLVNQSSKLHLEIRFEKGEHGDGDPFDGVGGTLAHAYFPIYGGDAHFDASETWTVRSYKGTNLFQVAAHEFGHSLGLSHSDDQGALMAPFYRGYQPNFQLHSDDIKGIQSLYGKKNAEGSEGAGDAVPENEEPAAGKPSSDNELCSDPSFDAIVTMSDEKTYVFKGQKYYKLKEDGIEDGFPRPIGEDFGGLEGDIDGAFTWTNGKTYFFKGSKYWRFTDFGMDEGYPKDIDKGFNGVPNNVDTAFVWSGNGKIYFMKDDQYWRFDPTQRPPVKSSYPKLTSAWIGIPSNIDGALQYSNGYTYFFKGGDYYRFNDRAFTVDSADPPFPRPTAYWWFGCPGEEKQPVPKASSSLQSHPKLAVPITGADDVYEDNSFDAARNFFFKLLG